MERVNLIDQRHELVKLAGLIDWHAFAEAWGPKFESTTGRPALDTRLMASLLYLKHTFALSDEEVVERWIENSYWQHFSGERYFQHELPCDPSILVRWRQRIGEEGCEWLLEHSIKAAMSAGVMKSQSLATVIVDTTVQPKDISHPTDSRLLDRAARGRGARRRDRASAELRPRGQGDRRASWPLRPRPAVAPHAARGQEGANLAGPRHPRRAAQGR